MGVQTPAQRAALVTAILAAAALIAPGTMQREGWKTVPYRDTSDVWTVCGGETRGVDPKRVYTDVDCRRAFLLSLTQHGDEIASCLPAELPVEVRGAFTDAGYNLGSGAFCGSSMARLAKAGDLKGACAAISLYHFSGKLPNGKPRDCRIRYGDGHDCPGIIERRDWERAVCEQGLTHSEPRSLHGG